MPYFMDGDSSSTRGKGNLKKRAARFIDSIPKTLSLEKLNAVSYDNYPDIETIVARAQAALMYICDVDAYSRIEYAKHESTVLPAVLPELEVINKCYFFVSMIGIVDKHIVDCRNSMEHHAKFMDNDEYSAEFYYRAKNLLSRLAIKRELLLQYIKNTEILERESSALPNSFIECLEKVPMFEGFSELYKNVDSYNTGRVKLISSFTNAYNTGYNACCNNIELSLAKFNELYNELHAHMKDCEKKVAPYIKTKYDKLR